MLPKKLLAVCPEKVTRGKKIKNKKTRMAVAKLFALNANAKSIVAQEAVNFDIPTLCYNFFFIIVL